MLQGTTRIIQRRDGKPLYRVHPLWVVFVFLTTASWSSPANSRNPRGSWETAGNGRRDGRYHAVLAVASLVYQLSFVLRLYETVA